MNRRTKRARGAAVLASLLLLGGVAGCGGDGGGYAALPATDGKGPPPELPRDKMGTDGRPKDSHPNYDTAHGAAAPK